MPKLFENETRVKDDECAKIAKDYQNVSMNDYSLWNNYNTKCLKDADKQREEYSVNNLNLHFRNGYGFTTSCEVDRDTELRLNGKLTHEKPKTQLFTRSFVAVPDLSKGTAVPNLESRLMEGDDTSQVRECHRLSEQDYNRFTPMLPYLKDTVQNPKNIITPWTFGGDSSRDIMRNSQTLNKCGYKHNGKYWERPVQSK